MIHNEINNDMIGEFMGCEEIEKSTQFKRWWYRYSWDWIIPVIEKIESLNYGVTIHETECDIYTFPDKIVIVNGIGETKLEGVYNAVVEFIKMYNKKKQ